jgi:hypothetical protein
MVGLWAKIWILDLLNKTVHITLICEMVTYTNVMTINRASSFFFGGGDVNHI